MKIAVFENELASVKGAFDTANLTKFGKQLEIEYFTSSQNADFNIINEYIAIFIDIDLSQKSELDGFGVISKIKAIDNELTKKIIILTGNNKIRETMKERNIENEKIEIVFKPTDYLEISKQINRVI